MSDVISYTELAQELRTHPCFVENPESADAITPEAIRRLRREVGNPDKDQFVAGIYAFMRRPELYDPLIFLYRFGWDDKGRCIVGKPGKKKAEQKTAWWFADLTIAPGEFRQKYYKEHVGVTAVNDKLEYVDVQNV